MADRFPYNFRKRVKNLYNTVGGGSIKSNPSLRTFLQPTPTYTYAQFSEQTFELTQPLTYLIVKTDVSSFNLRLDGINGVKITNVYDPASLLNCRLHLSATSMMTLATTSLSVGQTTTVKAAYTNRTYTLYYFTTGSLIFGVSLQRFQLDPISAYPPFPTPSPSPSPSPSPTARPWS